jgi:predicted DNA-binding protein
MARARLEPGTGRCPTLTIRVAENQRDALAALKKRTGRTPSQVLREALDAYLANLDEHSGAA